MRGILSPTMVISVTTEIVPGERRVALTPAVLPQLIKAGLQALVQRGAGERAGFPDAEYASRGATIVSSREEAFGADVVLQIWTCAAKDEAAADISLLREGGTVIGLCDPLGSRERIERVASTRVTSFALELIPRITRAQSMDVLSSQSTIAGYKAAVLAADYLPRIFPMMMTAAGTLAPAKVLVIGAGVAGLHAIASSRKMGAVVSGYDIRPAVKEQVQSLGARFVELELEAGEAEGKGGYAMDEAFYARQRELLSRAVAESDVVITTAAVPGKRSPVLVTAEMVRKMSSGSVIVDLAAERGGNCELTRADETVITPEGITILGPTNLPGTVPYHASQMYAKNIATFLLNMMKDGLLKVNMDDEIIRDTLLTRAGEIVNPRLRETVAAS
ncbi:MAG TPA: Re/Si-specific NAD(P)(+) transhydrogenase subunit alpha [Phycisphaerales bacterium]|nr:Re/Si-specific NAD(P)(+) transhydrogenase subunit alpha [Phycisphaerales bacterium]